MLNIFTIILPFNRSLYVCSSMNSLLKLFLVQLIVASGGLGFTSALNVYPDFSSTDCSHSTATGTPNNITNGIQQLGGSDHSITLKEPGCYWLSEFNMIENMTNVIIIGYGDYAMNYSIHCSENVGLAFGHVKGLEVRNVSIIGCGVSSVNAKIISEKINETIDTFYRVPTVIGYAVTLVDCSDVEIDNVFIANTIGIGLLGINVVGSSKFQNLRLANNKAPICQFTERSQIASAKTVGGGMFILYQDYFDTISPPNKSVLLLSNVYSYNNSFCESLTSISVRFGSFITTKKIGHQLGSAGGVGITLGQLKYSVEVSVTSSTFNNNTGWETSGAAIIMYAGVKGSKVVFDNCWFIRNGFSDYGYHPFGVVTAHAGLLVVKNAKHPYLNSENLPNLNDSSSILVTNTIFDGNSAEVCASMEIVLFKHFSLSNAVEVMITNTVMRNNQGKIGPVLCASNKDGEADLAETAVEMGNVTITDNRVRSPNENIQYNPSDSSGQILLIDINILFSGNTEFKNNSGVAIIGVASNIYFSGSVLFHRNHANFGGALQLLQGSHIIITNNSHLEVSENSALFKGGGIYVNDLAGYARIGRTDCFLFFQYIDVLCNFSSSCPHIAHLNFSFIFRDNTAAFGGTIFGSTLNDCPWYYDLLNRHPELENITSGLQLLSSLFNDKFTFSPPLVNSSIVSTDAITLEVQPVGNRDDVNLSDYNTVYPGERLHYNILARDAYNYQTNALLVSKSDKPDKLNATLSDAVYWFIHSNDQNGTTTPVDITGVEHSYSGIDIFSSTSPAVANIKVKLLPCGFGFHYDNSSMQCVCSRKYANKVDCNIKNQTLTVGDNQWFGPVPQLNNLPIYQSCFYDFCKPGRKTFKPYDIDLQCNEGYNRTGLLCTSCKNNTGTIFGSNRCCECSNKTLFWIPVFAVAGILIVITIAFLDISVAEGYLSGFILYCNCLNYFIPYLSPTPPTSYIFLLVSWVNLDVGIESCFYAGMSELARVGLRLVFPTYLYLLMFIIVILSRYSKLFAKIPFSGGKTFATLFILTYFSIFGTCVFLLGVSKFEVNDENSNKVLKYYGWTGDVSQPYGHKLHIPLIIIASLLMSLYILPIPLLLMFPSLLYRFRYTHRLKPILDAFWNPYKKSFRFWLGARMLFRIIAFTLAMYVNYPMNVFWFGMMVLLSWFVQERFSPYQGFFQNAFDSFFILNLLAIFFGNIFFELYRDISSNSANDFKIFLYITVLTAYFAFSAIVVIHLLQRFPLIRNYAVELFSRLKKRNHFMIHTSLQESDSADDNNESIPKEFPKTVTFTEFREPLLDGAINSYSYDSNR